ncbi:MAG: ABC transporter permease subunit [Cellvibrionaceae bacterium]|nr:ABC transporter permease subunit [Cellvibrionaceae bacterium]
MLAYFVRRLLLVIPTFIGITLMVFMITRVVPGGPVERMLAEAALAGNASTRTEQGVGAGLSQAQRAELEAYYGFDQPLLYSYIHWLGKVVQLDLGYSTRYGLPVWDSIKERLPVAIFYGFFTVLLTYLISVPLGIVKAIKHQSAFDNISSVVIFVGYAIPGFVLGILLIYQFAARLEWFPLGGFSSDFFDYMTPGEKLLNLLHHAVLPLTAYLAGSFAFMTLMMKNTLMDNLSADYMRTAMAKGLSFNIAVYRHALRNSLIPLATNIGHIIGLVLSGSFLVETVFTIDGLGLLGYESIIQRDYPTVMGVLVISSMLFLLGNILSDLCVALVDPRVTFGAANA